MLNFLELASKFSRTSPKIGGIFRDKCKLRTFQVHLLEFKDFSRLFELCIFDKGIIKPIKQAVLLRILFLTCLNTFVIICKYL